jgi:4a-hydroxytetrahydrobiopterin dehydratase
MSTPATPEEVAAALMSLPAWSVGDGWLTCTRTLDSFPAALDWVQAVGRIAEEMNHHPDIDIRWRTVTLRVRTHDAGDRITGLDLELAARVEALGAGR